MIQSITLPRRSPAYTANDYWELLQANISDELIDNASWKQLATASLLLPSPAFLVERTLTSPRLLQLGCHVWPWRWEAALANAERFPQAAFLGPHIRALQASQTQDMPYLHLMAMWDAETTDDSLRPQVFLAVTPGETDWQPALSVFARHLNHEDFSAAWQRCAACQHANIAAFGVYLGREDLPVRATVTTQEPRQWPNHPNWPAVDKIIELAGVSAVIAVAPEPDPGLTWHVPLIASRHAKPHQALAPLVDALHQRGMVDATTAQLLKQPPQMIAVPEAAMLDGQPALLRLMVSLERLKIVVEQGEWVSAKACYVIRLVWRTQPGYVLVED